MPRSEVVEGNTPSPAPVATPPAPPSAEDEDRLRFSDALRRRVFPRRGGIDARLAPLPPARKAWSRVLKAWSEREKLATTLVSSQTPHAPQLAALASRLADPAATVGTVEEDATLLAALAWTETYRMEPEFDAPLEALVLSGSLAHAVAAQLAALELPLAREATAAGLASQGEWRSDFHSRGALRGLPRLRELLVLGSEPDYLAARDVAAEVRATGTDAQRVAAAFLFPTEKWAEQELTPQLDAMRTCLLASLSDPAALSRTRVAGSLFSGRWGAESRDPAASLLDGCGAAALPFIVGAQSSTWTDTEMLRAFCAVLAAVGSDEAMKVLLETVGQKEAQAALAEAAVAQPRRAMRLLGEAGTQRGKAADPIRSVLGAVVRRFPALVDEVLPKVSPEAARLLQGLRSEAVPLAADAALEDLPTVLRDPPWARKRKAPAPVVVAGFALVAVADRVAFGSGEQEDWARRTSYCPAGDQDWPKIAAGDEEISVAVLAACPSDFAAVLSPRTTKTSWYDAGWYPAIAARHGLAALAFFERRLETDLAGALPFVVPFGVVRFAPVIAAAYTGKKSLRADARTWLLRHPEHAAAGLLTSALGKAGRARQDAETALRLLATSGHGPTVLEVARRAGVQEPIAALLASDPIDRVPAKAPRLPSFVDPAALTRPLLASKQASVPAAAMEALLTALALSPLDEPYAGLAQIREACDPASLARFAWELFQLWLVNGAPSKEGWCMNAVGHFGDDTCARRLATLVREWPGEAAHARAVAGLDVLAAIGSDVALMHLNGIALKARFKGLQGRAQQKIEAIAETRGLTREELEDRLAPDLGLDEDGSMQLDFGPRQFRVGFDEQLRPFVADSTGSRLKDLPKPKQSDDAPKAQAAAARWSQLKKDARTSASLQILRLELAMCAQRRFAAQDFLELFVRHPLVFHVVRRLVWAAYDEGRLTHTFRVAEDRSLADPADAGWTLPRGAQVGIPHPLELPAEAGARWGQVLADYQIVQPFPQLGRPTFQVTEPERRARALARVKDLKVPTGKVLGLEQRRWRRGAPQDGGVVCWMEKRLADGRTATLDLNPGLYTGMLSESPEQTLGLCCVDSRNWSHDDGVPLGEVDPIVFSELVGDLERLRG